MEFQVANPLVFAFVIAMFAFVGRSMWKSHQERQDSRALARRNGWQWQDRDDSLAADLRGEPFGGGFDRRGQDVIYGSYPGDPLLDRAHRISSAEPGFAASVFQPPLVDIMRESVDSDWCWRFERGPMIAYEESARDVNSIIPRLTSMSAVLDAVPASAWTDYGSAAAM